MDGETLELLGLSRRLSKVRMLILACVDALRMAVLGVTAWTVDRVVLWLYLMVLVTLAPAIMMMLVEPNSRGHPSGPLLFLAISINVMWALLLRLQLAG